MELTSLKGRIFMLIMSGIVLCGCIHFLHDPLLDEGVTSSFKLLNKYGSSDRECRFYSERRDCYVKFTVTDETYYDMDIRKSYNFTFTECALDSHTEYTDDKIVSPWNMFRRIMLVLLIGCVLIYDLSILINSLDGR